MSAPNTIRRSTTTGGRGRTSVFEPSQLQHTWTREFEPLINEYDSDSDNEDLVEQKGVTAATSPLDTDTTGFGYMFGKWFCHGLIIISIVLLTSKFIQALKHLEVWEHMGGSIEHPYSKLAAQTGSYFLYVLVLWFLLVGIPVIILLVLNCGVFSGMENGCGVSLNSPAFHLGLFVVSFFVFCRGFFCWCSSGSVQDFEKHGDGHLWSSTKVKGAAGEPNWFRKLVAALYHTFTFVDFSKYHWNAPSQIGADDATVFDATALIAETGINGANLEKVKAFLEGICVNSGKKWDANTLKCN
jgi:hypothetical protein